MVIDGAINGELFLVYVEQEFVKTLKEGDIVVLANLNSHKVAGMKVVIERVGVQVECLPTYSPDFNPIENIFSKLKLRTMEALWQRLGELCDVFLPDECKNYFKYAGYKPREKPHSKF